MFAATDAAGKKSDEADTGTSILLIISSIVDCTMVSMLSDTTGEVVETTWLFATHGRNRSLLAKVCLQASLMSS